MIRKKLCMLGAYAVGKTSLVRRFVTSLYSESYLTTVGVKIDRKEVLVDGTSLTLLLWDIHGEDEFQRVQEAYLRGASGYFLVVDPLRSSTLKTAAELRNRARGVLGEVPCIVLLNKCDLAAEWECDEQAVAGLLGAEVLPLRTSAKDGSGVEEAFLLLARAVLGEGGGKADGG